MKGFRKCKGTLKNKALKMEKESKETLEEESELNMVWIDMLRGMEVGKLDGVISPTCK